MRGGQAEHGGQLVAPRCLRSRLRQPRRGETAALHALRVPFQFHGDRADTLLQHDPIGTGQTRHAAGQDERGADRRMAREGEFARRSENSHARPMGRIGRGQYEDRLGVVEFPRDRLHLGPGQAGGIQHDREGIAPEAPVGEYVARVKGKALRCRHGLVPPGPDRIPAYALRASAGRPAYASAAGSPGARWGVGLSLCSGRSDRARWSEVSTPAPP